MKHHFWIFGIIFSAIALFFLTVGLRGLIVRRPFLFPARAMFALMVACFLPSIFLSLELLFDHRDGAIRYDSLLSPAMFLIILVMFWIQMRGYMVYGVNAELFGTCLRNALLKLGLPFQESFSVIRLQTIDADLQASVQSWMGTAQLRIKPQKHEATLKTIAKALREEFLRTQAQSGLTVSIFYILLGLFMVGTAWRMSTLHG
jgi:hypothetical protein